MNKDAKIRNIIAIVGIIIGVVILVLGFTCGTDATAGYETTKAYGGDAYTGIQNAAAMTSQGIASAVDDLNKLNFNIGLLLSALGLITIVFSALKIEWSAFKKDGSATVAAVPQAAINVPQAASDVSSTEAIEATPQQETVVPETAEVPEAAQQVTTEDKPVQENQTIQ